MNHNYAEVQVAIAVAARASGRSAADVTLVAVTKTIPWEKCSWLYALGHRDFGENRIVEALEKEGVAPADCRWHFIGTLQNNKVRKAIGKFSLIHSVDTFELAEKISQCSLDAGVTTAILLQANTSGESSKHGLTADDWKRCYEKVVDLKGITVQGLMTMAPETDDEKIIRRCFANLRVLRDELKSLFPEEAPMNHLSMGMSHDFPLAIAEGATIVRIGTALFK